MASIRALALSPETLPPGRSMTMTAPHPRRTPSKDMQMLVDGRKRQKLDHASQRHASTLAGIGKGSDQTKVLNTHESSSSDQSASRWFDDVNKNGVPSQRGQSQFDEDPPFYMSNRANYLPASFVASESERIFGNGPHSRMDSENEDLRGVIDDLTVENKKLRQILRTQRGHRRNTPSDVSQQQDRLFEVRMHGLPPEKRRELEYLLKNFATSVHTSIRSRTASVDPTSPSGSSSVGHLEPGFKASNTDSGYASQSHSGQSSGLTLANQPYHAPSKSKRIKNYLHDIPDTLLPKRNPLMSERAKMALVVRRLEQLFTGRKAAPGEHSQPIQQQEVSHSAARADLVRDPRGHKARVPEGNREAHVMPPDSKVNFDALESSGQTPQRPPAKSRVENSSDPIVSRPDSPDQRPTRPLDLDIHRAQVAADNIQYIRHLGLSTPQLDASLDVEEGDWIYLNLLTSMAQLHTLNVTPEFVRKAIKKMSKRFELSKDGHRVHWVGGSEGTKFAADDEKALEVADISPGESGEDAVSGESSKHCKSNSTSNAAMTSNTPSEDKTSGLQTSSNSKLQPPTTTATSYMLSSHPTKQTQITSAFDYKPVVYRAKPKEYLDDSYLRDSDESFGSSSGDSSGLVHALSRSNLNKQTKEEGPLTFYTNPFFCSDFSADTMPTNMSTARPAVVGETLGIAHPQDFGESPLRYSDATYFYTPSPNDQFVHTAATDPVLHVAMPASGPLSRAGEEETQPIEFEACGLGGVSPEDNFALDVKMRLYRRSTRDGPTLVKDFPFSKRKYVQAFGYEVSDCQKVELLPSKLPSPSYIFFTSSSSSDLPEDEDDDDASDDSDESSSDSAEVMPAPPAFMMQLSGSSGDQVADDEDDGDDSSSIDMLAAARAVNPSHIAEQERVYMITQPGGINRAVAGSLAATVGASRSSSSHGDYAGSVSSEAGSQEENEMEMDD